MTLVVLSQSTDGVGSSAQMEKPQKSTPYFVETRVQQPNGNVISFMATLYPSASFSSTQSIVRPLAEDEAPLSATGLVEL